MTASQCVSQALDGGTAHGAIHNMSVPPRSVAEIRPLRPAAHGPTPGAIRDSGAVREPDAAVTAGFFARVFLSGVLYGGRSTRYVGQDIALCLDPQPQQLWEVVAMLRTGRRRGKALAAATLEASTRPFAQLHDEFLTRIAALGDLGLPSLLLARPIAREVVVPRGVPPKVAIRLLAGTAGGLFVRQRAPSAGHFLAGLPGAHVPWDTGFDYYLPSRHE